MLKNIPMLPWARAVILLAVLFEIRSSVSADSVAADTGEPFIQLFRPGVMPEALDCHGSAVVGNRLYIFGGKKANAWSKEAWSGEIMPDTTVKNWRTEAPLPEWRTHIAELVQVVDNRIYIIGGLEPPEESLANIHIKVSKNILWTRVGPDGTLEPWQHAAELKVRHGATVATDAGLYIFGGMNGKTVTDVIHYSPFGKDGTPGPVREAGKLPTPLYYEGATYMDKRFRIWGGQTSLSPLDLNDAVYTAALSADGTVSDWTVESRVPVPVFRAGFLGFNDYIVSVGGFGSGGKTSTDKISFARLGRDGKLDPWLAVKSDMESRMFHSVAVDKDRNAVFITGGRVLEGNNQKPSPRNVITTIQAFALPAPTEKRIDIKPVSAAALPASKSGLPVALPILEAIELGKTQKKQTLVFFFSPQVPACRRAWENVINTTTFAKLTANYLFATVDSTGPESVHCYKFNVFRVPAMVIINPDGSFSSPVRIESEKDVQTVLDAGKAPFY
jgi:hypothetical protein